MSLIDDALKKTQSALKQKPSVSSDASSLHEKIETSRPIINPKINAAVLDRKKTPYFSDEKKDLIVAVLTNRYLISIIVILMLLTIAIFTHGKIHQIAKRYVSFYGQLFHETAKKPVAPVTPVATKAPVLILDGTLEAGNERAALINNTLYHTGDTIGGYTIHHIGYNQVILIDSNTHQTQIIQTSLRP